MVKFSNCLLLICIILAMTSLQGCHSAKSTVTTTISDDTEYELFTRLTSDYKAWSDVYMPVTLSVSSPLDMSISGRATLVRDSDIYISLRMMGFEVAVAYINNEYIYIIDKFNKRYIRESLSQLPADIPVTVSNIQDMLLGRAFLPGITSLTSADASKFSLTNATSSTWTLTPLSGIKGADWHFNASRTNPPVLTGISMKLASGMPVECVYLDQKDTVAGLLASSLGISSTIDNKKIEINITWGLDDAKWDSGKPVKFSAPGSSYKRVSTQSLIKSFKLN